VARLSRSARLWRFALFVVLVAGALGWLAYQGGWLAPAAPERAPAAAAPVGARAVAAAPPRPSVASGPGYFAAARLARDQAESRELAQLEAMADDPGATPAVRAQAQEEILQLGDLEREEAEAELVLRAKGYPETLVLLEPSGAVVVVEATRFDAAQAALVAQTVASVAGLNPDEIQVVTHP
jgi:stage III sporulation protein AH